MKTTTYTMAGSRMNGTPAISSLPRLSRVALVIGAGLLSIAVLGASKASPTKLSVNAAPQATAPAAGTELLQNVEASTAATVIPAVGSHTRQVWVEVTAYCACPKCCGPKARGLTASGRSITYNGGMFVAADTKVFKFGTKLQIPGYADGKTVEVIDRGGAIKGYHIDVFFPTHEEAKQWGRRRIMVTIVD
jgi:3D (Asp-Asp-Asp) domain-containing protein